MRRNLLVAIGLLGLGVALAACYVRLNMPITPAPSSAENVSESSNDQEVLQKPPANAFIPSTPEHVLASFRVDPGLRVELVAAEPEIQSPISMVFDEDGRLWVAEYLDYPLGPPSGQPPEGRIKVLEDLDGDGRYEHSRIFADQVLFPEGVFPWRNGALVTAWGQILWFADADGDGQADRREVLFEGPVGRNSEHTPNHPILGLDNWVYISNGQTRGQLKRGQPANSRAIDLNHSLDFRLDPLNPDRYEAISGGGQYGNAFDDWGRRFVCENNHHIFHVVLPKHKVERNPFLAPPALRQEVSELEGGPMNSGGKIYPLSKQWTTSALHVGRFTAACGTMIYLGDLLPAEYRGSAFTCEPTGSLVHQEILRPHGATFRSWPARAGVEFLATPNDWFRPVAVGHGPDGALYVVDMCRAVVEHPDFQPPELKNRPDLTAGKEHGRIWRVVPAKVSEPGRPAPRPQLSQAGTPELVKLLAHPNAWWRTTAQRLLVQRQDRAAVEPLRQVLGSPHPVARVHAAWLLDHFGVLSAERLLDLLRDAHPRVRENAVQLAEPRLAGSQALKECLVELAADSDAQVRFQVALSLGEWDDDRILPPLAEIALRGADDLWTRLAVASSVPNRAAALITLLLQADNRLTKTLTADRLSLFRELAILVGTRGDPGEVHAVLEAILSVAGPDALRWQMGGLTGLAEGTGRRGIQLEKFVQSLPNRNLAERINDLLNEAGLQAADDRRGIPERVEAVRLLAHASWPIAEKILTPLVAGDSPPEVRLAAVRSLAAHPCAEIGDILLKNWSRYIPAVRHEVIEVMAQRPERIGVLFQELESGRVKPVDIDALRTRQLLNHGRPDIRDRARKLLQQNLPEERQKVLSRYQAALSLKGDPHQGRLVFQKNCAACHRVAGIGIETGPLIEDYYRTKSLEALLMDILNPNQAVGSNYVNYHVLTKSGNVLTGLVAAETASSITLRRAENQTDVVLRADVEEIQSSGVSLMPEGLEKTISVAEMADLLAFIKNWRYLGGEVPLSGPPAVRQGKDVP